MPGTLRLILNLFDDLLDNFFFIFSLFKFKQVHSKSFKFRSSHYGSKTVKKGQKSSNLKRSIKNYYQFTSAKILSSNHEKIIITYLLRNETT